MRWLLLLLSLYWVAPVRAQVGVTICACQPSSYEFTLDLTLACADSNVRGTVGVTNAVCLINTLGENVSDTVPVTIDSVTVLEVDQQDEVIGQQVWNNVSLSTGSSFLYESVLSTMPQLLNETTIPTGIQLFLRGTNALGQQLVNIIAVVYDNNCSITAEVTDGQQIGWTVLSQLGSPNNLVCPLVTAAPTQLATKPPSQTPTIAPSQLPLTNPPTTVAPTTEPPSPATTSPTETPQTTSPTRLPQTGSPSQPPQTGSPSQPPQTRPPSQPPQTEAPNLPPITPEPIPTFTDAPTPAIVPTCPPIGKGSRPAIHSKKMKRPSKSKKASKISKSKQTHPLKGMSPKSTKSGEYYGSMKKALKGPESRHLMIGGMTSRPTAGPTARTPSPTACPEETVDATRLQQFHRSLEYANERMYLMARTLSRRLEPQQQHQIRPPLLDAQ